MLASSRGLTARRGLREGHGPPLQAMANAQPNGVAAALRANVGRDALIPPGLRWGERHGFESLRCGGRERPPYGAGQNPAANRKPALPQGFAGGINPTPTNKGGARGQPRALPHRNPCRGRFHIGPVCGGAGLRGRIWNPPLQTTARACDQTGSRNSCVSTTLVGDDACIVPPGLPQRRDLREGHGPPLQAMANARPGGAERGSRPITFQIITQARGLQNTAEPPGLLMQKKRFGCEISAKKCRVADKIKIAR